VRFERDGRKRVDPFGIASQKPAVVIDLADVIGKVDCYVK
jgi:hypothetical protein